MLLFVSVLIIPDRSDIQKTTAKVNYNISEFYILLSPLDLLYYQPRLWSVDISTQLINELALEI